MKNLFIGIDFAKEKFDVALIHGSNVDAVKYHQFENTKKGCAALLKWVKEQSGEPKSEWLFCGEHTGLYSVVLSEFLVKKELFMWLENPLQIKRSIGIKREKNDKVDSREIALYAYRFQDKSRAYQLPDKDLKDLDLLLSHRERLLKNKHALQVSSNEIRAVLQRNSTARYIYEQSWQDIERIDKEIKKIEDRMKSIIKSNESLNETYEIITSLIGIALINAATIIVATENFTRFQNSRQFACYAGMAPFGKQSGSALNRQPHVSHLANKTIKKLLTQAVRCAIQHDMNMRHYYQRKLAEGKIEWVVINNLRNKFIHRMFALVDNKQLYQVDYQWSENKNLA
ncbi:IS110 family transposase [Bacteroidia bacterium]|nr:IS110 family transposase [Bacteroidia bacterium]